SALDDETVCLKWFSKGNMPRLEIPYPLDCLFAENESAYFVG
ncbi:NUDIX hydrolase, partial [Vibrio sp. 2091]|nr:NUDIX hydrolase [Vibrio sp. 2091]